ncbi:MAG: rhamnulose-1-phosphate aldolase [Planctomycetota bacterium]|jgi:rhamnulose-1-phosphate aldolase
MNCEHLITTLARITRDMWDKGWIEANGGNISVRLDDEEKASLTENTKGDWIDLPIEYSNLENDIFLISGTSKFLRNIELAPLENIGFIKLNGKGSAYTIVGGFTKGASPTSELFAHLGSHSSIKDSGRRVVIHNHATNLITLTFVEELTTEKLSKILWQMQTESMVVFPKGIEFIPWLVPGSIEIGAETAKACQKRPLAVWQYHGIFATGKDPDETMGRIHVAEKAAEIYLKAKAAGGINSVISDQQLLALAERFNLDYDKSILETETGL